MSKRVKVTDPKSKYFGQEFDGGRIYFDIYYTGNGPDLFQIKTPDGSKRVLSTQIDTEHYENQELTEELERLGANVGDTVIITRSGGGCFRANFDMNLPHKITNIDCSGHVEFDNGEAKCFRPDVNVVMDGVADV